MIMNYLRLVFALSTCLIVSACAGSGARTDYYLAVQQAAQAQAQQTEARYRALATIANGGDPASKAMATMAIAMNQEQTIAPAYIEDSALKWAQVLANPLATVGMGVIQAGVAKNASNNAKEIQMASFSSNEAIQLGQQNMVTGLGSQWSSAAAGSADLAIAGFTALNTAGEQTVELGVAGLGTADSIAGAGFTANENIATVGFTTVDSVATTGFTTVDSVATTGMEGMATLGLAGMTNLNEVSQYGMTTIGEVATTGMTDLTTLGTAGIDAVGTVGTTGMNLLDSQGTNYAQVIASMQATIDAMATDLGKTVVCADDGNGNIVCS
jgi:hypothetical protein